MRPPPIPISPLPGFHGDDVAMVVRRHLERPMPRGGAWGLLTCVVVGVASFGLLPLLVWPMRFREFVEEESRALQEVAEWARARGRRPAAVAPLLAAADDLSFRPFPWLVCVLLAGFLVASFAIQFAAVPLTWDTLLAGTYYYPFHLHRHEFWLRHLHQVWAASLTLGYLVHWMQVRTHRSDVNQFIARLNPLIEAEALPPVPAMSRRLGVGLCSILAAVLFGMYGVWWGIPMVLAAGAQKRYVRVTSQKLRRELINRMRDISEGRRMPAAQLQLATCTNGRCQAPLHPAARFCTRCGSPAGGLR